MHRAILKGRAAFLYVHFNRPDRHHTHTRRQTTERFFMKKALATVTAIALALPATAALAQEQEEMPTIIVTAPRGMSEENAKRWERHNRDAAKLETQLVKYYEERRDDISDVKEAREDYEDAKDKLEDEEEDMRRTTKDIEKAEKRLREIEKKRARLQRN